MPCLTEISAMDNEVLKVCFHYFLLNLTFSILTFRTGRHALTATTGEHSIPTWKWTEKRINVVTMQNSDNWWILVVCLLTSNLKQSCNLGKTGLKVKNGLVLMKARKIVQLSSHKEKECGHHLSHLFDIYIYLESIARCIQKRDRLTMITCPCFITYFITYVLFDPLTLYMLYRGKGPSSWNWLQPSRHMFRISTILR